MNPRWFASSLIAMGLLVGPFAYAQDEGGEEEPPAEEGEGNTPPRLGPGGRNIPFPGARGKAAGEGGEGEGNTGPGGGAGGPGGRQGGPGGRQGGPGGRQGGPEGGEEGGPEGGGPGGPGMGGNLSPEGKLGASADGAGTTTVSAQRAPCVESKSKVTMDYVDAPVADVVKYMAEITCKNFIIKDDLSGKITIISHTSVTVAEAYEAFLSALEVTGYTTVTVGKATKVVSTSEAANAPLKVYQSDDELPSTDNFVTQIIQLENVPVSEMASVVKELAGAKVRVVAYSPTNTLIVTDSAYNIRRVYKIISQLDVAAPKQKIEVMTLKYATAADVEKILEEVYAVTATSSSSSSSSSASSSSSSRSRGRNKETAAASSGGSATSVGSEGAYIGKIISDERTNSIIVMANDEAMADLKGLVAKIDVDVDPSSRSQIHVVYLENAQAEDVASVLQNLSQSTSSTSTSSRSSSSSSKSSSSKTSSGRSSSSGSRSTGSSSSSGFGGGSSRGGMPGGQQAGPPGGGGGFGGPGGGGGGSTGVTAAFDSGMRITADDNTNSLVIIASNEDFRIINTVIEKLDIMRRQVFVEAVVLEIGSEDEFDFGIGYHMGIPDADGTLSVAAAGLNGSSLSVVDGLGLADSLSGLAMGVFGESFDVSYTDPTTGTSGTVSVPAFGIAINALASNAGVDIISNPSLLIVDNEEAKINVGRNVPMPVSSGTYNNGQSVVSYDREDVGIELTVTPQINEANYVTMELALTVAEVEEDSSGLDVTQAGFITSEREMENVVVVQDNQTIVIGGLIGSTATQVETKIPILGDIPLIGALFRGQRDTERKTNLLIFLTPHVINEAGDLEEVYRIKWAQRQEFIRRFYGKSRDDQQKEIQAILAGSMNVIDQPSQYRTKTAPVEKNTTIDLGASSSTTTILPPDGTAGGATTPAAPAEEGDPGADVPIPGEPREGGE